MNTRRLAVLLAVAAVVLQAAGPAGSQPSQTEVPPWLARLSTWLELVAAHKPGALDTSARLLAFWTEGEMDEVRTDFLALTALCKREMDRSARPAPIVYRDTLVPVPELRRRLGLADTAGVQARVNGVLKHAAIVYADVVMLVVPMLPGKIGCSSSPSLLVKDGSGIGMGCVNTHWLQARALLDAVRPDPAQDETVRLWYVATVTFLLESGNYANARPHLEKARLLFRSDPEILFARGYYSEAFASPHIQAVVVERGGDQRNARSYLEEAEDLYGRAIKGNPQFVEARVRRGNVLSLLGRQRDAAEELRLAVAGAQGPTLRYYATLFLGQAEQSVGNASAARGHYKEAAALFPEAQSPLLAAALLERQFGDRARAQEAMQRVLGLPAGREAAADPWTNYYRWQNMDFKQRFAALHARLAGEEAR
jgi:hypothetical protein